ncbi:MAG TPA: hypothetical protein VK980_10430 [Sphingomonas sp.]|nr:hypothetical protein [Sphingomonas sp.]
MPIPEPFVWSARVQSGIALFAVALAVLAVVAPNEVAISCAIGGGASLALFGISGGRLPFIILALLALVTLACALVSAFALHRYGLLPVAFGELTAVVLIRTPRGLRDYEDEGTTFGRVSAAR